MKNYIELTNQNQLKTFKSFNITITHGKGSYIWDVNGTRYLDFYGGHAVALTGHCHPHVVHAIQEQVERLIFYSTYLYSDIRAEAIEKMISLAPKNISKVFLCNSGTEANETAIKIARKYTGKNEIISMNDSFHGRTIGSLSATGIKKYRDMFSPNVSHHKFVDFSNIEQLKETINKNSTAAVLLEPIQSMAGVNVADSDYYRQVSELCIENGCLLIFDEVQTGFGRTGKMFVGDHWDIQPDLITFAKGIASGIPMGGVFITEKVADKINYGEHGSTFGSGQIACAAAKATLEVIENDHLVENASKMESYLRNKIIKIDNNHIVEIRGKGLLLGLKLDINAKETVSKLMEHGVICGGSDDPSVVRLLPPLIINKDHIDEFCQNLTNVWSE